MALVAWSDKLSVGIPSLDEQHTVLFATINNLHTAMMKGQARSVIGSLLHTLASYTRNHFAAEEVMMESAGYPALTAHRIQHRRLTEQVEDYTARYDRGDVSLGVQLSGFLTNWLTNHILRSDKEYGPCLKVHGAK